eukprot:TRINITY_DN2212_c0_g1_i2.p1 TRINITY_DN2212_c0_g1~~TRINITY_DN2212_c0_g1_i2.p1  ORF type:complete len:228 (-),score=31.14 TRINITY_DN2212_c0_g1_i2:269-952(-)
MLSCVSPPRQSSGHSLLPFCKYARPPVGPTMWYTRTHGPNLKFADSTMTVEYDGVAKFECDAGSVRSDFPVPRSLGMWYYEITVAEGGSDGSIAIGFSLDTGSLTRLPGIERDTCGWHALEGRIYSGVGHSQIQGESYGSGDVIGCCFNFITNEVSFTKNGSAIKSVFRGLSRFTAPIYPMVGIRSDGAMLHTNFGEKPFLFDIVSLHRVRTCTRAPLRRASRPLIS